MIENALHELLNVLNQTARYFSPVHLRFYREIWFAYTDGRWAESADEYATLRQLLKKSVTEERNAAKILKLVLSGTSSMHLQVESNKICFCYVTIV